MYIFCFFFIIATALILFLTYLLIKDFGVLGGLFRGAFTSIAVYFITLIVWMLTMLIVSPVISDVKSYKTTRIPLVAMSSQDNISGSFILASGSFEGEHYYQYFVELERGIKRKELRNNKNKEIYIVEKDSSFSNPHLKIEKPDKVTNKNWVIEERVRDFNTTTYYTFVVPKGTITKQFKAN